MLIDIKFRYVSDIDKSKADGSMSPLGQTIEFDVAGLRKYLLIDVNLKTPLVQHSENFTESRNRTQEKV